MIFSETHIEQIKAGTKTQTRRSSDRYHVGRTYAVQPCRTCKGIPEGRILITEKIRESTYDEGISERDAQAEGGYTVDDYENLYYEMHKNWLIRWAYTFTFIEAIREFNEKAKKVRK